MTDYKLKEKLKGELVLHPGYFMELATSIVKWNRTARVQGNFVKWTLPWRFVDIVGNPLCGHGSLTKISLDISWVVPSRRICPSSSNVLYSAPFSKQLSTSGHEDTQLHNQRATSPSLLSIHFFLYSLFPLPFLSLLLSLCSVSFICSSSSRSLPLSHPILLSLPSLV